MQKETFEQHKTDKENVGKLFFRPHYLVQIK